MNKAVVEAVKQFRLKVLCSYDTENPFQLVMLVDLPNHLKKKFEPILILVYCEMYRMYLKDPEHHYQMFGGFRWGQRGGVGSACHFQDWGQLSVVVLHGEMYGLKCNKLTPS